MNNKDSYQMSKNNSIIGVLENTNGLSNKDLDNIYHQIKNNNDIVYQIILNENINLEYQKYLILLLSAEEIVKIKEKYNWNLPRIFNSLSLITKDVKNITYDLFMELIFDNDLIPMSYKTVLSRRICDITLSNLLTHIESYVMDGIDKEFLLNQILSKRKYNICDIITVLQFSEYFSDDEIIKILNIIGDTPTNLCQKYFGIISKSIRHSCSVNNSLNDETKKTILLKLLPFDVFLQYYSNFLKIKQELIIDIYLHDSDKVINFINQFDTTDSERNILHLIKKIYLKFAEYFNKDTLNKIGQIILPCFGLDHDDKFILYFVLTHIDIDQNFINSWTYLEYIIYNTAKQNNEIKLMVKSLFNKSKNLTKHQNINIRRLINLNMDIDIEIIKKISGNRSQQNLFDEIYPNYDNTMFITINAMDPLKSTLAVDVLNYTRKWKIIYDEQPGEDAGGVIRDFYYILGNDIKKHMTIKDNYYYINEKTLHDQSFWIKLGMIFGKMLVIEKYPCGINLHPYILYRILNPQFKENDGIINLDRSWFTDIDVLNNIYKLYNLPENSWKEFSADLEIDIGYNDRDKYCTQKILEYYDTKYQPALNNFIEGFWYIVDAANIRYFNEIFIGQRICGQINYKILDDDPNSLKNTLYDTESSNYINCFLNVLDQMNKTESTNIQKLFRFWLGSPYLDFKIYRPIIKYTCNQKYCFHACTCSYVLFIPCPGCIDQNIRNDNNKLTIFLKELTENTIKNQDLCDETNGHLQTY